VSTDARAKGAQSQPLRRATHAACAHGHTASTTAAGMAMAAAATVQRMQRDRSGNCSAPPRVAVATRPAAPQAAWAVAAGPCLARRQLHCCSATVSWPVTAQHADCPQQLLQRNCNVDSRSKPRRSSYARRLSTLLSSKPLQRNCTLDGYTRPRRATSS
jgi:hypothetical protein